MKSAYQWGLALGLVVLLSGCDSGPDVSEVTGTVKLDGNPVKNALVIFQPDGSGVPAFGRTNDTGVYTLTYKDGVDGTPPGKYIVSISTFAEGDPDMDPPQPKSPETIPVNYNQQSELTANVSAGDNTIDFDLESGAEVQQPADPDAF